MSCTLINVELINNERRDKKTKSRQREGEVRPR